MRIRDVLLIVETSTQYGRELLRGIAQYAFSEGHWSIYLEERGQHKRLPAWVKDWRGDGIIVRGESEHMLRTLIQTGCPIVETDPKFRDFQLPLVFTDDHRTGAMAVEHFLHRCFRNLYYCSLSRSRWSKWRGDAFVKEAAARGITAEKFLLPLRLEKRDWREQRNRLARWLEGIRKPAAILAEDDFCGNRLLDVCRWRRIPVPEQVAVMGVDDDPVFCHTACPSLSSIDLNAEQIGYQTAALLDRLMRYRRVAKTTILVPPAGIVERMSTNTLAVEDKELAAALGYIRRYACEGIQVSDVCEHLLVSRRGLERKFQHILGKSPKEEIMRVRIDLAKRLLTESHLPVAQIARRTGFQTANYFANVFQRETGQTATAHRRQHR